MDMNLPRNLPKNQSILLTEAYLDKIHLTAFTFVGIIVVFFAAGTTNSTTQMTFTNTNIRFFHRFMDPEPLIGFELLEIS
jgi:hypothetical protein